MRYALLNPQDGVDRLAVDIDPTVGTRAGWRWVPAPVPALPAYDPATQALDGPVRALVDGTIIESYTVRAKTAAEIDADRERTLDRLDAAILRVLLNHENRLRAIEGKAAVTATQFRAAIKALL